MRSTPLQRARRRLMLAGYAVGIIRTRRGRRGQRYRPFAAFDLLALAEGKSPLAVLVVTPDEVHHLETVLPQTPAISCWLAGGNRLQLWCCHNVAPGRRHRWLRVTLAAGDGGGRIFVGRDASLTPRPRGSSRPPRGHHFGLLATTT